jgi:glycerol-3-phosphate dehydrogenase
MNLEAFMWQKGWRDQLWTDLEQPWDVLIIGGGITGAGILREASRAGLRALLVEAHDFASGTSSRSSKLVHGGFRYLKNGQIKLTYESVRERERLLKEGRGLVNPLGFLLANYRGDAIPGWVFGAALVLYDLLAFQWGHRRYDAYDMQELCPPLTSDGLRGGYRYFDAQTDDARLVLRLIQESVREGGAALNYTRAKDLLLNRQGQVRGAAIIDETPGGNGRSAEVQAYAVINATGAWADELRGKIGQHARLRRLRGSHLILPASRVPLTRSVSFLHPGDDRPVFAFPWEGVTLVGTTDVDLDEPLYIDPAISPAEAEYLLQAAQYAFSCQELTPEDVQCTYSGVRPVINTGKSDPSKESREYVLWSENGLLTITGGKLTTFRLMACEALNKIRMCIPDCPDLNPRQRVLNPPPSEVEFPAGLSPAARLRLLGRHGQNTPALMQAGGAKEFEGIGGSPALWAELRWAARAEAVVHLDDLLLRRTRLGLLLPRGGQDCMQSIRAVVQPELGWEDARWESEAACYIDLWQRCYQPKP